MNSDPLRIAANATSTPPLISAEYERGVREACSILADCSISEEVKAQGYSWRIDFPQIQACIIADELLPSNES